MMNPARCPRGFRRVDSCACMPASWRSRRSRCWRAGNPVHLHPQRPKKLLRKLSRSFLHRLNRLRSQFQSASRNRLMSSCRCRLTWLSMLNPMRMMDQSLWYWRMLTNYAEFLDLDSEGLMLKFADALQTRRLELAAPQASAAKKRASTPLTKSRGGKPPSWRRFLTLDLVLGGGLFLVLIVFVLWGAGRVINLHREDAQPTLASISDILMTPNADLVTPTADMTASVTPMAAVANTQAPPVVVENTAEATELVVPTLGSAPISVYIVASQRAWMRVTVDTTIVFEGRTIPGNAYPFTGRESIELLTGNGAALQVIYNENDLGTLGTTGEVVDIAFTRDGTVVPTTQPTVTPTPTTQPSATLQPTLHQITPSITPYVP